MYDFDHPYIVKVEGINILLKNKKGTNWYGLLLLQY